MVWPAIDHEDQIWDGGQIAAVGPAATRLSQRGAKYSAAVPPMIAALTPLVDPAVDLLAREAEAELARLDEESGHRLSSFGPILLRSEAASSSQIENLTASARQIFTAELGGSGARNAAEIAANTRAMTAALELSGDLSAASMREMHRVLMEGQSRHTPGEYRTEPVWIGTSASSPIGASYVAPAAARVPQLVVDLAEYCARNEIPAIAHMATAHAQFETIHPFTDGNGRTGRALAQAMLRRSRVTRSIAVPISAGLLTDVAGYHDALTAYRSGDLNPIVQQFAAASLRAVPNAHTLMSDLDEIAVTWQETTAARKNSAKQRLLHFALERPVFTADMAAKTLEIPPSNVYRYLKELQEHEVLAFKAEYQGPAVWRAPAVLTAIDRFAERAGRRGR